MAGHKRPNGTPVCPPKSSPAKLPEYPKSDDDDHIPQIGKFYHFVNPNYREQLSPQAVEFERARRTGTPCTWVSTEPADDIPSVKHERTLQRADAQHLPDVEITGFRSSQSSAGSSISVTSTTSSRFRRNFYSALTTSVPAVSLFATPRDEISTLTEAARMNGLHAGFMRSPRSEVKEEGSGGRVKRLYSWWVLMGKDPVAVEYLLQLQERADIARLDNQPTSAPVAASTNEAPAVRTGPSPFYTILTSTVGGFIAVSIWFMVLSIW